MIKRLFALLSLLAFTAEAQVVTDFSEESFLIDWDSTTVLNIAQSASGLLITNEEPFAFAFIVTGSLAEPWAPVDIRNLQLVGFASVPDLWVWVDLVDTENQTWSFSAMGPLDITSGAIVLEPQFEETEITTSILKMSITFTGLVNEHDVVQLERLEAIPEPSVLGLVALGTLYLVRRRRG